ncbi:BOI-related E3 ubiquitin-protein ligase 1-like protein [Carex littledalei]|uniref:BOI-related E3 ubiquitin-protein ligase 1-like protein n=1 Tax=Carex littledalei TaxID=544730 RepID=A0A833W1W5_9POAL|nr:BOI-related E3 ubiquitin-protein ligase 1-like protein [Carex littledalei]
MAVHAQYPSNLLLLDRTDHQEDKKERMDLRFSDSARKNLGKRTREEMMVPTSQFSGQPLFPQPATGTHHSSLVSTGLCLSLDEQQQFQINQNNNSSLSTKFSRELAAQIARQNNEIELFLIQQGEQLRRAVAEKQRRNYNALSLAVEEMVARKIREKQVELNRAAHLTVELEDRLDQLRSDSAAWQKKALTDQATATTLHAQLQQATAAAQRTVDCETGPADDAESGFIDPRRVEPDRSCRACRLKPACVVVFPCRHLCLCEGCEVASSSDGDTCPVCCCVRSGSLKVFFS